MRLVRQLLTESIVIASLGSICGLLLAWWGVRSATSIRINGLARLDEVTIDGTVLVFTIAVTLAVGLMTGLAPALRLSRWDLAARLREGSRALGNRGSAGIRSALVAAEFALALMVVVGAGLLIGSLTRLKAVETGIGVNELLSIRVSPPTGRYDDGPKRLQFFDALTQRLEQLPGVGAVGVSMALPPNRIMMHNPFTPEGRSYTPEQEPPLAEELIVSPGYFPTLGIQVLRGRAFTENDREGAPQVTMINQTMAEQYFGGVDAAIGRWIQTGSPDPTSPKLTIVGVTRNVKYAGLDAPPEATIYVPFRQHTWWTNMYVTMRSDRSMSALMPGVRDALRAVDPNIPIMESLTLDQLQGEAVAAPRLRAVLLGSFALLSLLLATAGIYGVMSYSVSQRKQETSVRIALGAGPGDIVRRTLREGMVIAVSGIALGLIGAVTLSGLTTSLLFGVQALDGRTFGFTALLLSVVALSACAIPAWRAARTDPASAFRGE
jgi:putative ABC transport system permease protein